MPTYRVKPEPDYNATVAAESQKKKRYPIVYVKASPEIIDALEVGEAAIVTLKGKIIGLTAETREQGGRHELQIELREVEAYPVEGGEDEPEEKEPTMKDAIDKGLGYGKKKE